MMRRAGAGPEGGPPAACAGVPPGTTSRPGHPAPGGAGAPRRCVDAAGAAGWPAGLPVAGWCLGASAWAHGQRGVRHPARLPPTRPPLSFCSTYIQPTARTRYPTKCTASALPRTGSVWRSACAARARCRGGGRKESALKCSLHRQSLPCSASAGHATAQPIVAFCAQHPAVPD